MNSSAASGPAIETQGLTKRFGDTLAVDHFTLRIERGTTFGLIGPNGAGKSTTIKMLMGLLPPTEGTARILGRNPFDDPLEVRQLVGYVPELHHIDRWMRVEEAVAFCRALYRSWNENVCGRLLDQYHIDRKKKIKQLSKGTLVKLSLVLAVSHEPELLILDEPMAGLDPLAREEFLDGVLRTICDGGQSVLISTHSLDDVQRLADSVGLLYDGRLLFHRDVQDVLATTKRIRATLAGDEPESVDSVVPGAIWQRVEGRLWELTIGDFDIQVVDDLRGRSGVEHVEVVDIGLEDLFKDIVKGQRGMR